MQLSVLPPSYLTVEQNVASLTIQAVEMQVMIRVSYIYNLLLAECPRVAIPSSPPASKCAHKHGHSPTHAVPWGCGPAPLLTGAVGGHVVVGMLAVVLDGCSVGGQVVPGGEGDKAMLQLWWCFAVSN